MKKMKYGLGIALAFCGALAVQIVIPQAPATAVESSATPITAVSLERYASAQGWPSNHYPSFAILITIDAPYLKPGQVTSLELPEGITAVWNAGTLTDADGTSLATYVVEEEGRRVAITFGEAVRDRVEVKAKLALFGVSTGVSSLGGTLAGEAKSGGASFPVSMEYPGAPWNALGHAVAIWESDERENNPENPSVRVISTIDAEPEWGTAAEKGQWIGVGQASENALGGSISPIPGTTRLYRHLEVPDGLQALTSENAELREGADFSVTEHACNTAPSGACSESEQLTAVQIPKPEAGYYVVEQRYEMQDWGGPFLQVDNPKLPEELKEVNSIATRLVSSSVAGQSDETALGQPKDYDGSRHPVVRSGVEVTAQPATAALTAQRSTHALSTLNDEGTAEMHLRIENNGTVPLSTTATERATVAGAGSVRITKANSSRGVVRIEGSTQLVWRGTLAPGESATVTYRALLGGGGLKPGTVSIQSDIAGISPTTSRATATVPDTTLSIPVSGWPAGAAQPPLVGTSPEVSEPSKPAVDPGTLVATGGSNLGALGVAAGALLVAGAALVTVRRLPGGPKTPV